MALPFKIIITCNYYKYKKSTLLHPHSNGSVKNLNLNNIKSFKEDYPLSLTFLADKGTNYKMYSPDLTKYHIRGEQVDTHGQSYYLPSDESYELYNNEEPLSANMYTVTVTNGINTYNYYFFIRPKELNSDEWKSMIKEINEVSEQLAFSHVNNQEYGLSQSSDNKITKIFATKLANLSNKIAIDLHLIITNINYKDSKGHKWIKSGKEKAIDAATIKEMSKSPSNDYIYVPFHYINYNTNSNRWIKHFVSRLLRWTISSINIFIKIRQTSNKQQIEQEKYEEPKDTIDSGNKYSYHKLLKFKYYLIYILSNSILSSISSTPPNFISKKLVASPRYNQFYKVYRKVRNAKRTSKPFIIKKNQSDYKNTNKLYEYWTFIETLKEIKLLGYQEINEYIPKNETEYLWPLVPNTRFIMNKNDIKLRLVYDDPISKNANYKFEPIKPGLTTHTRPDIRIDIYKRKQFLNSIILDAKYKKSNTITKNQNNGQLLGYAEGYVYRKSNKKYVHMKGHMEHCVNSLFVLYPTNNSFINSSEFNMLKGFHIYLEQLRPKSKNNFEKFYNNLKLCLDNIYNETE